MNIKKRVNFLLLFKIYKKRGEPIHKKRGEPNEEHNKEACSCYALTRSFFNKDVRERGGRGGQGPALLYFFTLVKALAEPPLANVLLSCFLLRSRLFFPRPFAWYAGLRAPAHTPQRTLGV